jgi:putative FmdB family regulatory protein
MPLYEYRCTGCGERIEVLQRLGEAWLTECPSCHGVLERMVSAPALQFKGSGFYITDYARSGAGAAGDTAKAESKNASDGAAARSDGPAKSPAASSPDGKPAAEKKGPSTAV